jgi:phosphoenolpyruvate carboxykinase (GTP)
MKWTSHSRLNEWIGEMVELCHPMNVHICDGSLEEYDKLCQLLVQKGLFVPLKKRPHSFWCHSDPQDVARVEEATFICSQNREDAGPTNNWKDPTEMRVHLLHLFSGCMKGRTMFVIPFCMGPLESPQAVFGVEITDSPYVVCNMRIMTRMGKEALEKMQHFVPCLHSVGVPLEPDEKDVPWPCRHDQKYIVHFPETREIWSFGSGYGGNALLGKKSLALRIASAMGRDQGWLAEHMLIMGVTNPEGKKKYMAAAFPSACGKTNFAMLRPSLPGWKVELVGDDIAWMKCGADGEFYAINPESGIFGVAVGTSERSNPYAMRTIEANAIFTNTAMTGEGDVWWEGMTKEPPPSITSWEGLPWSPNSGKKASHPNARFTAPIAQSPIIDPAWNDPRGVPISAIIFGGRRSSVVPLVCEAFNWQHGVFMGASLSSEMTAAAAGEMGKLRHDPFAMLPFCGYNMADYFKFWLTFSGVSKLPRIYQVNWFRKNATGQFVWPGFGDNIRVLKWIFDRISGEGEVQTSPIGYLPGAFDLSGLNVSRSDLFSIDRNAWNQEADEMERYFTLFGNRLPQAMHDELMQLRQRLEN